MIRIIIIRLPSLLLLFYFIFTITINAGICTFVAYVSVSVALVHNLCILSKC